MTNNRKLLYVLIFAVSTLFLWGCRADEPNAKRADAESSFPKSVNKNLELDDTYSDLANASIEFLKAFESEHPNRSAGSINEKQASEDLFARLTTLGYSPKVLPFEYSTPWSKDQVSQNIEVRLDSTLNTEKSTEDYILLGAHYDSVPAGQGADDNASGVSLLITLAEYLKEHPIQTDVVFVFFGAEEVGLKGSEAYVSHLIESKTEYPSLMINFDSLIAGDYTYVYGSNANPEALASVLKLAGSAQLDLITQDIEDSGLPYGETIDASDHAAFKAVGIPYLYFEATNWNLGAQDGYTQTDNPKVPGGEIWHTKNDKLPYIEETFPGRPHHHLDLFIRSTLLFLESLEPH